MEQQKVFATVWRGFDKKTVIDYIYEQDVLFKKKEAELNEKLAEYESRLDEQSYSTADEQPPELYSERIEALEQSCNEQRETAALLQEQCEKLHREADQLVQLARSKDGELQLQTELNRQLQQKCNVLEGKLKTLAEHLLCERETITAHVPEPVDEAVDEPISVIDEIVDEPNVNAISDTNNIDVEPAEKTEFTDLKGELNEFRQSVSQTLLNFEAALARLEADPSFFH